MSAAMLTMACQKNNEDTQNEDYLQKSFRFLTQVQHPNAQRKRHDLDGVANL